MTPELRESVGERGAPASLSWGIQVFNGGVLTIQIASCSFTAIRYPIGMAQGVYDWSDVGRKEDEASGSCAHVAHGLRAPKCLRPYSLLQEHAVAILIPSNRPDRLFVLHAHHTRVLNCTPHFRFFHPTLACPVH